jgi:protein-disulfide isomerase
MKNEPKKSGGLPLIIIGAVLVVAVIGAYALWSSSKGSGNSANRANSSSNTNRAAAMANAPLGANPPNMMGAPNASVTVEEFADFQCPACGSVNPIIKEVVATYGNRIRFIYRNFPLVSMHPQAYEAAVATEAARMQDPAKFWTMSNKLFETQQAWTNNPNYRQIWDGYAQEIGLDVERFKADMAGSGAKSRVDADLARGRGLSIDSTPTLLVNGKNIPLQQITVATLRQVIDAEIQNAMKTQPASNTGAAASPAANNNTVK